MSARPRAVVVGGGIAGLAAALELAGRGRDVTLLERAPRPGGRLGGFVRRGAALDNGVHVLAKACPAMRRLLDATGTADAVAWQPRRRLPFAEPGGRVHVLERWGGPAPWHLLPALLGFGALPLGDRLGARRALAAAKGPPPPGGLDFASWLSGLGQGERAVARLWGPLSLAVLNAPPAGASARAGVWLLREGLLSRSDALDLGLFRIPQAELAARIAKSLEGRGVRVRCGAAADRLVLDAGRVRWVSLRDGEAVPADEAVLAVPWEEAESLLPGRLPRTGLRPSCILSATLTYDRPVLLEGVLGLLDADFHWAFAQDGGRRVAMVLSAAGPKADLPGPELSALARRELEERLPAARGAGLLDAVVLKERRATFLPAPGSEASRPGPGGARLGNLALAGAWTATGWPATLEGAARSGFAAAEALAGGTLGA